MRKPSHSSSDGQETPLEGFDVFASASQDNVPRIAPQRQTKLSIVLGVCCRCNDRPAVLKSPSEKYIYCAECGRSRCGVHTVVDFVQEVSSGLWLDPCCVKRDLRQQSLVDVE
jgi:hypothetical protein